MAEGEARHRMVGRIASETEEELEPRRGRAGLAES